MKKIEVFEGNQLHTTPQNYSVSNPKCSFQGIVNGKNISVPFGEELLSQHLLYLGGIGTGKTSALFQIIRQLRYSLTTNDIMIIFDTKGDFYKEFYKNGDIVISNDKTATGANGADYWNIFNEINKNNRMMGNVIEISKTLFHEKTEKTQQPFFPMAAQGIFSAVLTHFIRKGKECNNETLKSFLFSSPNQQIRDMLQEHDEFKSMVSYIADDRSPQTQGVISELQQLSREILLENFSKKGTLSMRQLVRTKGGKVIFIEYDMGIGNLLSPIYSLLFDLAIKEALSRSKSTGNVYLITDEFSLLPNLQHIDDAVNFGRGMGIKFMMGVQNIDQIYDSYGEERARSILSGLLTAICFKVNDKHSKDFIMERFGQNRKKDTYMSAVQSRGIIENIRDSNVVEDWDISNLNRGQAIIGLPTAEPFLFQFNKY